MSLMICAAHLCGVLLLYMLHYEAHNTVSTVLDISVFV